MYVSLPSAMWDVGNLYSMHTHVLQWEFGGLARLSVAMLSSMVLP